MQYTDHLETARMTTRFLTPEDAAVWVEYCQDPVATQFTSMDGKTPEEMAKEVMALSLARYKEGRFGLQALISKETGAFIGKCGLMLQEDVDGTNEIEVSYHLLPKYWGKGYASEAAQKFRDYAFENNLTNSVVSIIHPQNIRSKKVAMRNGMQLVNPKAVFQGKEYELFRITRKEWEDQKTFYWSSLFSHSF